MNKTISVAATVPATPVAPATPVVPAADSHRGKGGAYRVVDGKRVLVERSEPAKDPNPHQGA